jgi:hypothetical protein
MGVRLSALSLLPGRFRILISVRGWVELGAIVRLEGLGDLKNPMTSSRIEPETFRLVAKCLNRVPPVYTNMKFKSRSFVPNRDDAIRVDPTRVLGGTLRSSESRQKGHKKAQRFAARMLKRMSCKIKKFLGRSLPKRITFNHN